MKRWGKSVAGGIFALVFVGAIAGIVLWKTPMAAQNAGRTPFHLTFKENLNETLPNVLINTGNNTIAGQETAEIQVATNLPAKLSYTWLYTKNSQAFLDPAAYLMDWTPFSIDSGINYTSSDSSTFNWSTAVLDSGLTDADFANTPTYVMCAVLANVDGQTELYYSNATLFYYSTINYPGNWQSFISSDKTTFANRWSAYYDNQNSQMKLALGISSLLYGLETTIIANQNEGTTQNWSLEFLSYQITGLESSGISLTTNWALVSSAQTYDFTLTFTDWQFQATTQQFSQAGNLISAQDYIGFQMTGKTSLTFANYTQFAANFPANAVIYVKSIIYQTNQQSYHGLSNFLTADKTQLITSGDFVCAIPLIGNNITV